MMPAPIESARPADAADMLALVAESGLPTDGLIDHLASAIVARDDGRIVGTAALELYPDGALLRSVAVSAAQRGRGLGRRLSEAAIALARDRGAPAIYLLTTTAERFFPRFGFEPITRADVPPRVRTSIEFSSACPSSAMVMRKSLE